MRFWLRGEDMADLAAGLLGGLSADEVMRQVRAGRRGYADVPDETLRAALAEIQRRSQSGEDLARPFVPLAEKRDRARVESEQLFRERSDIDAL